jgi:hypothetical protein
MKASWPTAPRRKFDKILSLGQACDTAYQIRRIFKQGEAYPFDWLTTSFAGLIEMIEQDFAGFLDEQNLVPAGKYLLDQKLQMSFLHDFDDPAAFRETLEEVSAKFQRRIKRWLKLLNGGASVLFVRGQQYVNDDNLNEDKARALLKVLQHKYESAKVHLLVQNPPAAGIPEIIEDNFWLLQLKVPEPWEWSGDDEAWAEMFNRVQPRSN